MLRLRSIMNIHILLLLFLLDLSILPLQRLTHLPAHPKDHLEESIAKHDLLVVIILDTMVTILLHHIKVIPTTHLHLLMATTQIQNIHILDLKQDQM
jgi:hypothetical protein